MKWAIRIFALIIVLLLVAVVVQYISIYNVSADKCAQGITEACKMHQSTFWFLYP